MLFGLLFILPMDKTAAQKTASIPALEAGMERSSLLAPWDDAGERTKKNIFVKVIANKSLATQANPCWLLINYLPDSNPTLKWWMHQLLQVAA